MGLIDSIIGAESGGNPNAQNPNSSASLTSCVIEKDLFGARVGELFGFRRPSAIIGRIISIGPLSIDGVFLRRLFSHIGQKCLETIAPAFAHLNAYCAVPLIRNVFWIFASRNHSHPRMIFGCRLTASANRNRTTVRRIGFLGCLDFVTSAAKRVAGFKIGNGDYRFVPTIASANHSPDSCIPILSDRWIGLICSEKFSKPHSNIVLAGAH